MTTDPNLETAARWLCEKRGENPNKTTFVNWQGEVANWEQAADEIRRHALLNEAVERAKLDDSSWSRDPDKASAAHLNADQAEAVALRLLEFVRQARADEI